MNQLALFNRTNSLFEEDLKILDEELNSVIENSKFLIVGGAGSIGQAVSTEIFKRNPKLLYVIDISENNFKGKCHYCRHEICKRNFCNQRM